jgi:hypothetical protein
MITEIKAGDNVIALHIDPKDTELGVHPLSKDDSSLQVLLMKRSKGYMVSKHGHRRVERKTSIRQKSIVVIRGIMHVTLCDDLGKECGQCEVSAGQCLYLLQGGYSIEMKEDCLFYEFKNGPHQEDKILY